MSRLPRLAELPVALKLGLTAFLLVLAGGYAASLAFVVEHHGKKDEKPGLSLTDLRGAFHGIEKTAPLADAVEGAHGAEFLAVPDRDVLSAWLRGDDLYEAYDPLDSLERTPAEILGESCVSCHARDASAGAAPPLEDWSGVSQVAFRKQLEPPPKEILIVSLHAHAQSMALVILAAAGLLLLTRWPAALRHGAFLAGMFGLLGDLGGMWLARGAPWAVWMVIVGGALYGAGFAAALLGSLADLWLPGGRRAA